MKVAYILKMYPRFSETFIVNEILELERQGVDVRIYSLRKPDDGRFHARLASVKASVVYVPQYPQMEPERIQQAHQFVRQAHPEAYARVQADTLARGQDYAIKRFLQAGFIAAHLLRHPVDAIHAHFASSATRVAYLVSQMIGLPYSFTAHAKDIYQEEVDPASLRSKIRHARFVVTVSRYNQQYLQEIMQGETADVRSLYNGVDLNLFSPTIQMARHPNLILSVGRLVAKKGFDVLIQACAELFRQGTSFECVIIGEGEDRQHLVDMVASLDLQAHIRLVGPQPQEKVLLAYQQAALFTLPCVIAADGNRDGLPTVLLEAMACGLPVISTKVTGVPEIIDHGVNGLLVEPGNAVALAEAITGLLHDPSQQQRMSLAARLKAEQAFDLRRNVSQLREWLSAPAVPVPPTTQTDLTAPLDAAEILSTLPQPTLKGVLSAL